MMDSTRAIDPNGDLLAILPTTTIKLQVSSKILSTASPVFRSMFSPRFREGAALASGTALIEIEFPDEPPQALEAVFNVLHFRHDCVSANVSYDTLYEIALVVDKYDLARALGPWKEVWLRRGAGDGGKGLFVMYVFGDKEGFREGCRKAILQDLGYGSGDDCDDDGNDNEGEEGKGEEGRRGARENGWNCDALPEKVVGMIYHMNLNNWTCAWRSKVSSSGKEAKDIPRSVFS